MLSLNWGRFSGSQSIVFSPDGRHLCCGTKSETGRTYYLTLWDVETGKCHVLVCGCVLNTRGSVSLDIQRQRSRFNKRHEQSFVKTDFEVSRERVD